MEPNIPNPGIPGQLTPPLQPNPPLVPQQPHTNGAQKIIIIFIIALFALALVFIVYKLFTRHKDTGKTSSSTLVSNSGDTITSNDAGQAGERDIERESDIRALHSHIEAYWAENGFYPTLANLNDTAWVTTNLKGLDLEALKDPKGNSSKIVSSPTKGSYSYDVVPANCNNTTAKCISYTLTATTEVQVDGVQNYTKKSLNDY